MTPEQQQKADEIRERIMAAMSQIDFTQPDREGGREDIKSLIKRAIKPIALEYIDPRVFDKVKVTCDEDPALLEAGKISINMEFASDVNCGLCQHSYYGYSNEDPATTLMGCRMREDVALSIEEEDAQAMVLTAFNCPWRSTITN